MRRFCHWAGNGYHTVTPYLVVDGAAAAIEFYAKALGAVELMRLAGPGGSVMHAEIMVGNSPVMLADANPEWGMQSPPALGSTPVTLVVYVENVDEVFQRAINAGGEQVRPIEDQFYGDRTGTLRDPFGQVWTIATHTEDLEPTEIEKRFEKMMANQKSG